MAKHALLSPSSAYRWLNCTPSAVLEEKFENKGNGSTEEGTAAHAFCEHKLKKALKRRSKRPVSDYDSDEMQECTDAYVDFVLEQLEAVKQNCKDPLVLIEQKVDFSEYVPDGFGTADCLIIADDSLHVIDFKYGIGVLVDFCENPQMKCYALGALAAYDSLYDIRKVSMSIFQPRRENVGTWTITVEDLKTWADEVLKPKALMASKGEGVCCPGDWCQFCRAAIKCRARAEVAMNAVTDDFKLPPFLSDEEIEEILPKLPEITKWANELSAYALDEAVNHGKNWNGFKVIEGRSIRKYSDEDAVAEAAKANGYTDIYKYSLITLTEMQKLMGKKKFDEILGGLIVKPMGKPTLVPVSDKRPVMNVADAKNDFDEIREET